MGLDGLAGLAGLGGLCGIGPTGPSFSVNGEPLANLYEYGDAAAEILLAAPNPPVTPVYYAPRLASLLKLRSGTIIGSATMLFTSGVAQAAADNTGGFIVGKTLVSGGSWSATKTLVTESSRGVGNKAVSSLTLLQGAPGDDTIYGVYYETVYANNAASPWKDFSGNTVAQTVAVKIWFLTMTESAGVLTINAATDITSNVHVVNNANLLTITQRRLECGRNARRLE